MRRKSNRADQVPTWTCKTAAALAAQDDFMSMEQLRAATGASVCQMSATLHHLSKRRAVESVRGGDGKLWWFATPETDDRMRPVEQRVVEPKGNRVRRVRINKP